MQGDPLVTVITPVFNGGTFLKECIDSILGQSYGHFEYIIVDNCSTDDSLQVAEQAASGDKRIKVVKCEEHVGPIQNWNRSLQYVDRESVFIKFVHADDWIFPGCLERMVEVAMGDERIGLVSAYRLEENLVSLDCLPAGAQLSAGSDTLVMEGSKVARAILLENASILGSPSNVLVRTALTRSEVSFFSEDVLHADKEAGLRLLQRCDFGFVRQVLTFTRRHNESVTSLTNLLDTRRQENLILLQRFGPVLLSTAELQRALSKELRLYYDFLARNVGTGVGRGFWDSHRAVLEAAGSPLSRLSLLWALIRWWANPVNALKHYLKAVTQPNRKVDAATLQFLEQSRNLKNRE